MFSRKILAIIGFLIFSTDYSEGQVVYAREQDDSQKDSIYFHVIDMESCDTLESIFVDVPSVVNFAVHPISKHIFLYTFKNNTSYIVEYNPLSGIADTILTIPDIYLGVWWMEFACPSTILISGGVAIRNLYEINIPDKSIELLKVFEKIYSLHSCGGELIAIEWHTYSKIYKLDKRSFKFIDSIEIGQSLYGYYFDCFKYCDTQYLFSASYLFTDTLLLLNINNSLEIERYCLVSSYEDESFWPLQYDLPYYELNLDLDTTSTFCQNNNAIISYDCNQDSIFINGLNVDYFNNYHDLDSMKIWINNPEISYEISGINTGDVAATQLDKNSMILRNTGSSLDEDFSDALRSLIFVDNAALPHLETYEINVQIFECGAESTPATIFLVPAELNSAGLDNAFTVCNNTGEIDLEDYLLDQDEEPGYWDHGTSIFDPASDLDGDYFYIVDNGFCGSDTAVLSVRVFPEAELICNDTLLCAGDSISFNGAWIIQSGQYFDTIQSRMFGCDSIYHELQLAFAADAESELRVTELCFGESLNINGMEIDRDTIFSDTLISQLHFCDSLYLAYDIRFSPETIIETSDSLICHGDTIVWYGQELTSTGMFDHIIPNINGCDSLHRTLALSIEQAPQVNYQTTSVCFGDSVLLESVWVHDDTTYSEVIPSLIHNCDSIINEFRISFSQAPVSLVDSMMICAGSVISWQGMDIDSEGQFQMLISDNRGCDSIRMELNVSQYPEPVEQEEAHNFCYGEVLIHNNNMVEHDTVIMDTIRFVDSDCDSLIILSRFIELPAPYNIIIDTITCPLESIIVAGELLENPGNYQLGLKDQNMCDSVLYDIQFAQLPEPETVMRDTLLCAGDSILIEEEWVHINYSYTDIISYHENACDSLNTVVNIQFSDPIQLISQSSVVVQAGVDYNLELLFDNAIEHVNWQADAGLSCSDCLAPVINLESTTSLQVSVTDEHGCVKQFVVDVIVEKPEEPTTYFIPNIINTRDPANDRFYVQTSSDNILTYNMYVYDRWGGLMYLREGVQSNDRESGWDGTFDGNKATQGVYVYLIEIMTTDGVDDIVAGDVLVVH